MCARYAVVLLMDAVRGAVWASITNQNTAGEAKLFRVKQGQGVIAGCAADMKQVALCLTVSSCCPAAAGDAACSCRSMSS